MEHQRRRETLRTCKAADFVIDLIVVGSQFGAVGVLIGPVGEFAFGVERKLEPLFIGLELLFVINRNIRKGEILVVVIGVKEVQQKL